MERIFSKGTLRDYWIQHPELEQHLKVWYETVTKSSWKNPNDVKATFANASILKEGRVVFNIKGNSFRLVTRINYEKQWVFIRFKGTHQEYDKKTPTPFEMEIKPIKTEADYKRALKRLEVIFDAPVGSSESDEADILALLIENYENKHFPIEAPDPIEAIKIRMEQLSLKQNDLADAMGGSNRVSEILNRKRKLTLEMVRNLTGKLNLSAEVLIQDYKLTV